MPGCEINRLVTKGVVNVMACTGKVSSVLDRELTSFRVALVILLVLFTLARFLTVTLL